jgi:hypothetical protein
MNTIKFPQPKQIDYKKYIQPKKQVFVTIKCITKALLIDK